MVRPEAALQAVDLVPARQEDQDAAAHARVPAHPALVIIIIIIIILIIIIMITLITIIMIIIIIICILIYSNHNTNVKTILFLLTRRVFHSSS